MNLRRLLAISRKEVLQVLRDSRSLLIVLLMPVMLMTTLGYGVNLDTKHIRVFALDREGSQASQDLLKRFQSSDYFDLIATVTDYRALTVPTIIPLSSRLGTPRAFSPPMALSFRPSISASPTRPALILCCRLTLAPGSTRTSKAKTSSCPASPRS